MYLYKSEELRSVIEHRDQTQILHIKECDPVMMIKQGCMPSNNDVVFVHILNSPGFILYLKASDEQRQDTTFLNTVNFWLMNGGENYSTELDAYLDELSHYPTWKYLPLEMHIQNATRTCSSMPLMFLAPEKLYKSMRPKTDMYLYRSPDNPVIPKETITDGSISINAKYLIPVTRYSQGMSSGLYNKMRSRDIKGYFYYYEEESTTHLTCNSMRSYFNKTDAYRSMIKEVSNPKDDRYYIHRGYHQGEDGDLENHIKGELNHDLMYTPDDAVDIFGAKHDYYEQTDNIPRYTGNITLYAAEDGYDQILSHMCIELGIEILVLTSMVGSNQIVTEVLDVRDDSFDYLVYTY